MLQSEVIVSRGASNTASVEMQLASASLSKELIPNGGLINCLALPDNSAQSYAKRPYLSLINVEKLCPDAFCRTKAQTNAHLFVIIQGFQEPFYNIDGQTASSRLPLRVI